MPRNIAAITARLRGCAGIEAVYHIGEDVPSTGSGFRLRRRIRQEDVTMKKLIKADLTGILETWLRYIIPVEVKRIDGTSPSCGGTRPRIIFFGPAGTVPLVHPVRRYDPYDPANADWNAFPGHDHVAHCGPVPSCGQG